MTLNHHDIWTRSCARLREVLHPDIYARWIAVIEPVSIEKDTLLLAVENDFYQSWLEDNYVPLIRKAVATECGTELEIRFSVSPRAAAPVPKPVEPPARRKPAAREAARRPAMENGLNPKFTFSEFIVGPSNNFAHAAALAVAQAPARAYNPLFIYGDTGLGKTHLMQAIGHGVSQTGNARIAYVSTESFTNEFIEALQTNSVAGFRKKYRNVDLLLIDDIHFLGGKERMQEEFFHTFNALYDAHKQIVLTSDRPAGEIQNLEARLVSRFDWGVTTELQSPDLETRIAILRNKKARGQLPVSDEAVVYIANAVRSNIRRLEGALTRVASYASLTKRELTLEELDKLLRDILDQEKQEVVSFDTIMRLVAEHYDIRLMDMTSKRRPQAIALPRQVAMYLCRRLTSASLPEIANAFGKTHATVLHAYHAIESRMEKDDEIKQSVAHLSRQLEHKQA